MKSPADVEKLKVVELRKLLSEKGLDAKGNKPELQRRLSAHLFPEKEDEPETDAVQEESVSVIVSSGEVAPSQETVASSQTTAEEKISSEEKIATEEKISTEEKVDAVSSSMDVTDEKMIVEQQTEQKESHAIDATHVSEAVTENVAPSELVASLPLQIAVKEQESKKHQTELLESPSAAKKPRRWAAAASKGAEKPLSSDIIKDVLASVPTVASPVKVASTPKETAPATESGITLDESLATATIRITNFIRPVNLNALRKRVESKGTVAFFWMDVIKSQCIATLESKDAAVEVAKEFHGSKWPENQPQFRILKVDFIDQDQVDQIVSSHEIARELKTVAELNQQRQKALETETQWMQERARMRERAQAKIDEASEKNATEAKTVKPKEDSVQTDPPKVVKQTQETRENRDSREQRDSRENRDSREPREQRDARDRSGRRAEPPIKLEDLFKVTKTKPVLYYLPLTEAQVKEKYGEKALIEKPSEVTTTTADAAMVDAK